MRSFSWSPRLMYSPAQHSRHHCHGSPPPFGGRRGPNHGERPVALDAPPAPGDSVVIPGAARGVHHPGPGPQTSQVVLPTTVGPGREGARRDDRVLEDPTSRRELREDLVGEAAEHRVIVAVARLERVPGPLRAPPGGQGRQPPKGVVRVGPPGRISQSMWTCDWRHIASSALRSLTRRALGQTSQLWPPGERNTPAAMAACT